MTRAEFEKLIEEEFPKAVPEKFHHLLKNVAFLVEDEAQGENLLGLYHGISHVDRGDYYGVGATLPDTITLYQKTIEEEASELQRTVLRSKAPKDGPLQFEHAVRQVIRETIWHEVAHYFGFNEDQVHDREYRDHHNNGEECELCSA